MGRIDKIRGMDLMGVKQIRGAFACTLFYLFCLVYLMKKGAHVYALFLIKRYTKKGGNDDDNI